MNTIEEGKVLTYDRRTKFFLFIIHQKQVGGYRCDNSRNCIRGMEREGKEGKGIIDLKETGAIQRLLISMIEH